MKTKIFIQFISIGIILFTIQMNALGIKPEHPNYLHALSDLRAARWMIEHRPGDWQRTVDEVATVKQIEEAINEIKKASIDDSKDINDHPMANEIPEHIGRLQAAVDYLKKAQENINKEEDNGFAQGLQASSLKHIKEAIRLAEKAISQ